jgi:hypothetical protein
MEYLGQTGSAPYFGFWPGTVVSDEDPDKLNRVRVRVPHVYGAEEEDERVADQELPWARPAQQTFEGSGEAWTPPVGAAVWVGFLGGSHETPVYFGGWPGASDALAEHVSSYCPSPATRIIKTTNGHVFEMRFKTAEEEIKLMTALGVALRLIDADALGGPKALLQTPAGNMLSLDDKLMVAKLMSVAGNFLELNDSTSTVTLMALATMLITSLGALTISALALTLAATGLMSITGVGLALLTTGAAVTIGSAGSFTAIVLAQFLTLRYDIHTHAVTTAPGTTGPPVPLSVAGDQTTNTTAN